MAQTPPWHQDVVAAHLARAGGTPLLVGQFRFYYASDLWEWSAEAAQIHGYPPIEMTPTSAQVMSHKHPDDHATMALSLENVRNSHGAINTRHRIIDVHGDTHEVIVVGQQLCDATGGVIGNHGFYVDVTPPAALAEELTSELNQQLNDAVAEIAQQRSIIEEVKGMLMLVYRIDAAKAFDLLRWRSQVTNTKLRSIAQQLLDDFVALDYGETLPSRSAFDALLLSAHERVPDVAR